MCGLPEPISRHLPIGTTARYTGRARQERLQSYTAPPIVTPRNHALYWVHGSDTTDLGGESSRAWPQNKCSAQVGNNLWD